MLLLNMKVIAEAERGAAHECMDLPCQDAVCFNRTDSLCVCVLADGAGSVESSDEIANFVVNETKEFLMENFDNLYALPEEEIKEKLLLFIEQKFEDKEFDPDCTLLFVAISRDNRILVGHIGDGIIIGTRFNPYIISFPENGSELNETYFLSGPNPFNHLRISKQIKQDTDTIIMSSDGLSNLLYNRKNNEFAKAINILRDRMLNYRDEDVSDMIREELKSFFKDRTSDDMSLIVINWKEKEAS